MSSQRLIDLHPLPAETRARTRRILLTARRSRRSSLYEGGLKRTIDIAVSVCALVVLFPVFVAIALAIKCDSPGPIFYRTRRVGFRGQQLPMLKFRKMRDDAVGLPLTVDCDPRLTRVGRILTESRLDELPQLWEVLRGRMSLIGPRPEDPAFVALHRDAYDRILTVRPGLTGLAQIAYKEESRIVDASRPVDDYTRRILPQKLKLDRIYASRCSFRLDVQICCWTAITIALGLPVSVHRATGHMTLRRRRSPEANAAHIPAAGVPGPRAIPAVATASPAEAAESPAGVSSPRSAA